jgi:hypothetical protein
MPSGSLNRSRICKDPTVGVKANARSRVEFAGRRTVSFGNAALEDFGPGRRFRLLVFHLKKRAKSDPATGNCEERLNRKLTSFLIFWEMMDPFALILQVVPGDQLDSDSGI